MATNNIGNLSIIISGNAQPFLKTLRDVKINVNQIAREGGAGGLGGAGSFSGLTSFFSQFQTMAVGMATAAGAAIKHAVEKAMDFQDLLVGFEVMTGSAEAGRDMLQTLERFSATLPFQSSHVMRGARTLAGNSVALRDVLPSLKAIATVVAGTGGGNEKFDAMVLAFAQVSAMGRLMGQELRQLNDAGFTIDHIARAMGVSAGEVRKLMEDGQIGASDVARAFNMATQEGGRFFGLIDRQAETTRGRMRRIGSEIAITERKIGSMLMEVIDESGALPILLGSVVKLQQYLPVLRTQLEGMGSEAMVAFLGATGAAGAFVDTIQPFADGFTENVVTPIVIGVGLIHGAFDSLNDGIGTSPLMTALPALAILSQQEVLGMVFPAANLGVLGDGRGLPPGYQSAVDALNAARIGPGNRATEWPEKMAAALRELKHWAAGVRTEIGAISVPSTLPGFLRDTLDWLEKGESKGDRTTPFDQFRRRMKDINELFFWRPNNRLDQGPLIDEGERNVGFARAFLEMEKGLDKFKDEFPKAMERGSVDAAAAINRAMYSAEPEDIQKRILRVMELQRASSEASKKQLEEIGRHLQQWRVANFQ